MPLSSVFACLVTKANITSCSLLASLNLRMVRTWGLDVKEGTGDGEDCGFRGSRVIFYPFHVKVR